jgi:hypothetical protein
MNLFALLCFVAAGGLLVFVLQRIWRARKLETGDAIGLLAVFVGAALGINQIQEATTPSATPSPILGAPTFTLVTPASIVPINPSDNAIFFDSLQQTRSFPPGNDANGRSWYEDGGYNVLSFDTRSSWIWVMPRKSFRNVIVEVEAIPVTDGRVTGYVIAVGWQKGNNYHKFQVQPNGSCGFFKVENQIPFGSADLTCPQPVQGNTVRLHLEIKPADTLTCMRAFINGSYIGEKCFNDYNGGLIGLGAYNGGVLGSGVESTVRFSDLAIWDYP